MAPPTKSSGTNSQGNQYANTGNTPAPGGSYRYSNTDSKGNDAGYYYQNPNGSTYHNDGQGNGTYKRN